MKQMRSEEERLKKKQEKTLREYAQLHTRRHRQRGDGDCSISADMRWMDKLPTATLGCERGTATRSV